MKKNVLIVLILFSSCLSFSQESRSKLEIIESPVSLNKTEFLKKIFDYKKNKKEWRYKGNRPAIIDFHATWCLPCRKVNPILEQLAKEYAGRIIVYKIDIDKEPELAATFGIRSVPAFFFIPMNGVPRMGKGGLSKASFEKVIREFLLIEKER